MFLLPSRLATTFLEVHSSAVLIPVFLHTQLRFLAHFYRKFLYDLMKQIISKSILIARVMPLLLEF